MTVTRIGSICSGYGGLDLAVRAVIGGELAWVADNDPGAAAILAHRFPSVPNLGDITATDWSAVEPVNVFAAGFPCQPVSAAGRHKGTSDERWLFDDICTAIGRMVTRPRLLVLENVPGLLSANGGDAMARVIQGLAALGYVGRYRLLRASDAGAPHRRERWFCVAWPAADAQAADEWGRGGGRGPAEPAGRRELDDDRIRALADATGPVRGWVGSRRSGLCGAGFPSQPSNGRIPAEDADRSTGGERRLTAPGQAEGGWPRAYAGGSGGAPAADPQGDGRDERRPEPAGIVRGPDASLSGDGTAADCRAWGAYEPAIRRWEAALGRPAPHPTEPGRTGERLSPRFVEWMQGMPEGWVTDVPGLTRNAQLKALGNGVVPRQAELALRILLSRTSGVTEAGEAA